MRRCALRHNGASALRTVLWVSVALRLQVCTAGRSGVQAAIGWSDAQPQVEQLNLETLPLLPPEPVLTPQRGGDYATRVAYRPPVSPTLHLQLAAALWAVGLVTGASFLLHLWHEQDSREKQPRKLSSRLPTLLCLGFGASVALGLGSFFLLLAAGVHV